MSRIDPSISLGVKQPQINDPAENLFKMRDAMDRGKLQQAQFEQMGLQAKAAQMSIDTAEREKADDNITRRIMSSHTTINETDGVKIDHDKIEAELMRAGLADRAIAYKKSRIDTENAIYTHSINQLELASKRAKNLSNLAQTVLNAPPELRPDVYGFSLKQAQSQGLADEKSLQTWPKEYNGEETDALLQRLADMGIEDPFKRQADRLAEARAANEEDRRKREFEARLPGLQAQTTAQQLETESMMLGSARDQTSWSSALGLISDEKRRNLYPTQYSESAREAAALAGLSPNERATLMKVDNEIELQQLASAGDKNAQAVLRALEEREIRIETAKARAKLALDMGLIPGGVASTFTATPQGQKNEDVLAGVAPGMAEYVRSLVDGRRPWPSGFMMRNPYWSKVVELAGQYEPGFDATLYKQRADTIKDFTSGQASRNVSALNTVTGHLDTLSKAAAELSNGDIRIFNSVKNWFNTQVGDPRIKNFQIALNAVADEMERVFRGSSGTLEGIKAWKETINAADSPAQLQSVVHQAVELMGSRIEALRDQYEKGMKRQADFSFLTDRSRETLKGMGLNPDDIDPPNERQKILAELNGRIIYTVDNGETWFYQDDNSRVQQ